MGKAKIAWTLRGQSEKLRGHCVGKADSAWTKWAFARTWRGQSGQCVDKVGIRVDTVAVENVGNRQWRTMVNKNSPLYNSHVCVYSVHNFFFSINYIVVK